MVATKLYGEFGFEFCDHGEESAACDGDCTEVICGDGRTNGLAGEDCDVGAEDTEAQRVRRVQGGW